MTNKDKVIEWLDEQNVEQNIRQLMCKKLARKFCISLAHSYKLYDEWFRQITSRYKSSWL